MMPKKQSKRWTLEETKAFLKFYSARKHEFQLTRKRRLAFSNVLQDMIDAGFDSNISVAHLEVKLQTLLRAYRGANFNCDSVSLAPYAEELRDIFGDKSFELNGETLNIGTDSFVYTVSEVPDPVPETSSVQDNPCDIRLKSTELFDSEITFKTEPVEEEFVSRAPSPLSSSSESRSPVKTPKRKITQSEYYERRLEQKEREYAATAERWRQHQQAKEEWRRKKLEMLQRILDEK